MTDARKELSELTRLVSGLVQWDVEDDAMGYTRFTERQNRDVRIPSVASTVSAQSHDDVPRTELVYSTGNPEASVVFVGEATKTLNTAQAQPFAGPSGELLDKMIRAMGLTRDTAYICSVVDPTSADTSSTTERQSIYERLDAIQPKIVVALGQFASQRLLKTNEPLERLRGQFHPLSDAKLLATFHPNDLLDTPANKRLAWDDLQRVMAEL